MEKTLDPNSNLEFFLKTDTPETRTVCEFYRKAYDACNTDIVGICQREDKPYKKTGEDLDGNELIKCQKQGSLVCWIRLSILKHYQAIEQTKPEANLEEWRRNNFAQD